MPPPFLRTPIATVGERRLLHYLTRLVGPPPPDVLTGIGDDAAVIQPKKGQRLLLSTDLLVEGVHFDMGTATMSDIGWKAAASNLSDIAAMGGTPQYLLPALALPPHLKASDLGALYRGILRQCRPHHVQIIGGDLSSSSTKMFIGITVIGSSPGTALTRKGARVGDFIYVTGTLGDSLAGLHLLRQAKHRRGTKKDRRATPHVRMLAQRHLRPTPRLTEGQFLAQHHCATAAIDLSDGLSSDLRHLCEGSNRGAVIEATALPISPACRWYAQAVHHDPIDLALMGGEDYELLFTASPHHRKAIEQEATRWKGGVTRIGMIQPHTFGIRLKTTQGSLRSLKVTSYQHFQTSSRKAHG